MRWLAAAALVTALPAAEPLPIVGLSHIGVRVSNLDASLRFYTGLLGIPVAFRTLHPDGSVAIAVLQVNDNQYIELIPGLRPGPQPRITHISLETTDAARLRLLMLRRGLAPRELREGRDGNLSFRLPDEEGNTLEFTEYRPTSNHTITRGQHAALPRISNRLCHAVILARRRDLTRLLDFYQTKLGFESTGGLPASSGRRIAMLRIPGARGDILEAMAAEGPQTPRQPYPPGRFSLAVPRLAAAASDLRNRGLGADATAAPRGPRPAGGELVLLDPDRNALSLLESPPRSPGAVTPATTRQPTGPAAFLPSTADPPLSRRPR